MVNVRIVERVLWALSYSAHPSAVPVFIDLIENEKPNSVKFSIALSSIEFFGDEIYLPLAELLKSEKPHVKRVACEGLGRIGDVRAIALLKPLMADKDPQVGSSAAIGLINLGRTGMQVVEEALSHPDPLAQEAARAAIEHKKEAELEGIANQKAQTPSSQV